MIRSDNPDAKVADYNAEEFGAEDYEGHTIDNMKTSRAGEDLWWMEHNTKGGLTHGSMTMNKATLDIILAAPELLAENIRLEQKLRGLTIAYDSVIDSINDFIETDYVSDDGADYLRYNLDLDTQYDAEEFGAEGFEAESHTDRIERLRREMEQAQDELEKIEYCNHQEWNSVNGWVDENPFSLTIECPQCGSHGVAEWNEPTAISWDRTHLSEEFGAEGKICMVCGDDNNVREVGGIDVCELHWNKGIPFLTEHEAEEFGAEDDCREAKEEVKKLRRKIALLDILHDRENALHYEILGSAGIFKEHELKGLFSEKDLEDYEYWTAEEFGAETMCEWCKVKEAKFRYNPIGTSLLCLECLENVEWEEGEENMIPKDEEVLYAEEFGADVRATYFHDGWSGGYEFQCRACDKIHSKSDVALACCPDESVLRKGGVFVEAEEFGAETQTTLLSCAVSLGALALGGILGKKLFWDKKVLG